MLADMWKAIPAEEKKSAVYTDRIAAWKAENGVTTTTGSAAKAAGTTTKTAGPAKEPGTGKPLTASAQYKKDQFPYVAAAFPLLTTKEVRKGMW